MAQPGKTPDPEEVKREIMKKLDEIDLESLTSLGGKMKEKEKIEPTDWWVWTVWRQM